MRLKTILRTLFAIMAVLLLVFVTFNIAMTTDDLDTSVFATSTTLP